MSKGNQKTANLVIEWSPKGVTTFDAVTKSSQYFESVQAAGAATGSREVIAAVSRRAVFVRTTRVPDAGLSDVRLVLSMKLGDLFPLAASDLAYDFLLTDDVDSEGRLAVVVAMAAQDLRRLHQEFKAAGYRIAQVVPSAFGSVSLVESLGRTAGAVVGREEDGIGIDLIEGRNLRYSRLSTNTSNPAAEVCRTYTVAGLATSDIIATGGPKFADSDVIKTQSTLEALVSSPKGLPAINLEIPEAVALRAKKARDKRQAIAAVLFAAALGLCGYAYYDYSSKASAVQAAVDKEKQTLDRDNKLMKKAQDKLANFVTPEQLATYSKPVSTTSKSKTGCGTSAKSTVAPDPSTATDAQSAIDLGFKYGQKFSDVAMTVVNSVPPGLWINGISLERGKRLVLRGTSKTNDAISTFTKNLAAATDPSGVQRLRDVRLEFTNNGSIDQIPVVQFSVSAFPVGNVPLSDPTKMKQK